MYTLEIPFHSRQSAVKTLHQFLNSCASRNIPEFSQKNFDVRRTHSLLNKTLPSRLHAKNLEENPTSTGVWIFVMRRRSLHACCEESGIIGTVMRVEKKRKSYNTNRRGLSRREMRWMLPTDRSCEQPPWPRRCCCCSHALPLLLCFFCIRFR